MDDNIGVTPSTRSHGSSPNVLLIALLVGAVVLAPSVAASATGDVDDPPAPSETQSADPPARPGPDDDLDVCHEEPSGAAPTTIDHQGAATESAPGEHGPWPADPIGPRCDDPSGDDPLSDDPSGDDPLSDDSSGDEDVDEDDDLSDADEHDLRPSRPHEEPPRPSEGAAPAPTGPNAELVAPGPVVVDRPPDSGSSSGDLIAPPPVDDGDEPTEVTSERPTSQPSVTIAPVSERATSTEQAMVPATGGSVGPLTPPSSTDARSSVRATDRARGVQFAILMVVAVGFLVKGAGQGALRLGDPAETFDGRRRRFK